jgi:tetratricopeptide (TPR) repeat protein
MFVEGYMSLVAIADDFSGWRDVAPIAEKARALRSSGDYKRAQNADFEQLLAQQRAANEINLIKSNVFDQNSATDSKMLLREKIGSFHKRADAPADSPDRRVARRILNQLYIESIESANYRGDRPAEINRALETLEIAVLANPKNAQVHFNRARLYCGLGKKKEAIDELTKAVELGFKDVDRIRSEKVFGILEKDDRFIKLLAKLN